MDDAIVMAHDDATLDQVQQQLCNNGCNFNHDGDFKLHLGTKFDALKDGSLKLSQPHPAKSLLDVTGMAVGAAV